MIRSSRLDNGVQVLSENMPGVRSVSLGCWFKSGSRHEPADRNGITHFVEHMLFRGTSRRTPHQIAREIDAVGGLLNAFTSQEFCCLYSKIQGDKLPMALDLLADLLLNSSFAPDEIDKERRVIGQELHMVEENPEDRAHDLFNMLFWQGHGLGRPTAGTVEDLARFDRDTLVDWHRSRFTADRLMICAAGDVDHDDLVGQTRRLFDSLRAGELDMADPPPRARRQISVEWRELEQVHFCLGTAGLSQTHPDRFAAFVLNAILGGGMSSRLFQVIREQHGLAYAIHSGLNTYLDTGNLVVSGATAPSDWHAALRLTLEQLADLRAKPVDRDLLDDTRECLKGNLVLSLESTDNRMTRLARNEYYLGRQVDIDSVLDAFDRVSAEDVQRVACDMFRQDTLVLQLLGPVEDSVSAINDLLAFN
ncbi:MAG: insulinase family protein [Deltaproteobacteria bacterium]|nr:MAG: insulinase family protein [Deltaproteobacteria bacterium]